MADSSWVMLDVGCGMANLVKGGCRLPISRRRLDLKNKQKPINPLKGLANPKSLSQIA